MSGVFGVFNYGKIIKPKDINNIIRNLGRYSSTRGTDAIDIACLKGSKIIINKTNKLPVNLNFNLYKNPKIIIGHTRLATQGNPNDNLNNQPFVSSKNSFALAHDGIITNYKAIREDKNLPEPKIKTDSCIAVQLLESYTNVGETSISEMCEAVEGCFIFSILDTEKNLYLARNGKPLTIYHFEDLRVYLYASTEDILRKSIEKLEKFYFNSTTKKTYHKFKKIKIKDREIFHISPNGSVNFYEFAQNPPILLGNSWNNFNLSINGLYLEKIISLENLATSAGLNPQVVELSLNDGYDLYEIETALLRFKNENFYKKRHRK